MRNWVVTTFLMTVLPGLLFAQQPARSNDVNFYTNTPQLQARIARFTAEPATSKAGQTVRLEWAVENPVGVSIEPGIGAVLAHGVKEVKPRQTTTYVLNVQGPRQQMITQEVTVTIPGTVPLKAVTSVKREVPRMPDGKPNLSGVYNMIFPGSFFPGGAPMNISNTPGPLETMPVLKAGAEKFKVVRGPDDAGSSADCHPPGVPEAMAETFAATKGPLVHRLLATLEAAQAAGGDIRGLQSAAIRVVAGIPGAEQSGWLLDVRIDDHDAPLAELTRLVLLHEASNASEAAGPGADPGAPARVAELGRGNPEGWFWYGVSLANNGRLEEAAAALQKAYAVSDDWRELLGRIPHMLPGDPTVLERLVQG